MITSSVETISVSRARELVTGAENPRGRVNPNTIAAYVRIMTGGGWKIGPPIMIDSNSKLLDGFQRLRAVIDSGQPQRFIVIRGVDRGAMVAAIDAGVRRQPEAVLRATGKASESVRWYKEMLSAILRLPFNYGSFMIINCDYPPLFDLYKDALNFAAEAFGTEKTGLAKGPVVVAWTRAWLKHKARKADLLAAASRYRFMKWSEDESDEPLRLLAMQVNSKSGVGSGWAPDLYMRAANALKFWLDGAPMCQLKRAVKDPFPIDLPW